MFGRRRRDPWAYGSAVPRPYDAVSQSPATAVGLEGLAQISRMPVEAKARLRSIDATARDAEDYARRTDGADEAAMRGLDRLVARDVPDVVAAWLALPPGAVLDDGRHADAVLVEQLGILQQGAQRFAHQALQAGRDGVVVEDLYLDGKYRDAWRGSGAG